MVLSIQLPFGCYDLDPAITNDPESGDRVRCFVRDCHRFLRVPRRGRPGEPCPEHGIRCHRSQKAATYSYRDARRNIIASPDVFAERVIGHPFKYESHRFGYENSEDAVSWNVWRSLMEAGLLGKTGEAVTGIASSVEPRLYLWGLEVTDDVFEPWPLLIAARQRFESRLPVDRPFTEPDIALHLPGKYLILIEAKFTSPNSAYERGPRKDVRSLTLDELLGIYQDSSLCCLNYKLAHTRSRIHYQLWRNLVFAEWMGRLDHPGTQAFHVNLVREGFEEASAAEFATLLAPDFCDRFQRVTWEHLYRTTVGDQRLAVLHRYLETKTTYLSPAFRLRAGTESCASATAVV